MKIKLITDYFDYYDAFFDYTTHMRGEDATVVFKRLSAPPNGYSKPEQFQIMSSAPFNMRVPGNGTVRSFMDDCFQDAKGNKVNMGGKRNQSDKIVVYTDNYLHAGNGKELTYITGASLFIGDDKWCSEFIPTTDDPENHSISYKYMKWGMHYALLKIECKGGWRTNSGDLEIEMLEHGREQDLSKVQFLPLYSIDYVRRNKLDYGVDFNTAPGFRGTGLKDYYTGVEVANSLYEWFEIYGDLR